MVVHASFEFNFRCTACAACAATVPSLLRVAPSTNESSSTSKYSGLRAEKAYLQSKDGSGIVGAGSGSVARAGAVVYGAGGDNDGTAREGAGVAAHSGGSIVEARCSVGVEAPGVGLDGSRGKAVVDARAGEVGTLLVAIKVQFVAKLVSEHRVAAWILQRAALPQLLKLEMTLLVQLAEAEEPLKRAA